ncbi:MAG: hypothetical protein IPG97_15820 [Microthrixaceae bacterium]|nr:hypothetical protein [Microthrixaceae bacterium]
MSASKTLGPVARAVRSGDNREALEAVRDKLAHEIDLVGEDDRERLAPLTGRLLEVLRALDDIAEPEVSRKDELRRRREDRRAAAGAAPRFLSRPSAASTAGPEAVELAMSAGLVLLPWQELVLDAALAETAEGFCASFEVALVVPRQNGKGGVLEAAELYWLFLDDAVDLITHTAHRFDTSLEHFTRIRTLVETTPELMAEVKGFTTATARSGSSFATERGSSSKARSKGGGRGFSGDRVVLDEAYYINDLGSLLPTMSARPDPQLWWTSPGPVGGGRVECFAEDHRPWSCG